MYWATFQETISWRFSMTLPQEILSTSHTIPSFRSSQRCIPPCAAVVAAAEQLARAAHGHHAAAGHRHAPPALLDKPGAVADTVAVAADALHRTDSLAGQSCHTLDHRNAAADTAVAAATVRNEGAVRRIADPVVLLHTRTAAEEADGHTTAEVDYSVTAAADAYTVVHRMALAGTEVEAHDIADPVADRRIAAAVAVGRTVATANKVAELEAQATTPS